MMVYLSANGEVIGQFDTKELPAVLAGGRIPPEAFFWREGMPEWRPLRELVLPPSHRPPPTATTPKIEPIRHFPAAAAQPAVASKLKLDPSLARQPAVRRSFAPRTEAKVAEEAETATALLSEPDPAPIEAPPATTPGRAFIPRHRSPVPAATPAPAVQAGPAPRTAPARRRGRWLPVAALLVLLLGGAGAAGWWFFLAEPPPLSGEVRAAGADGAMVPVAGAAVFLVSQDELAARWRGQSEEIQSRAAEFDALLEEARASHREKSLVLELAARVSEVADEYNMPDAEQLRAERDAAQATEAAALAEVERLTREKDGASAPSAFLGAAPEAIAQTVTDETGAFRLPLPGPVEGLAVLVVSEATASDAAPVRGWLAPLDPGQDLAVPLRFSPDNTLDTEQIRQIAAATP